MCNQVEYAALIATLNIAKEKKVRCVQVRGDSKLVCNQVAGNWEVKSEKLQSLYQTVKDLTREFQCVEMIHVPREQNFEADGAAKKFG